MQIPRNWVVVDLETTGTNPQKHDVVAVALVPFRPGVEPLSLFVTLDSHHAPEWNAFARQNFEKFRLQWEASAMSAPDACAAIERWAAALSPGEPVILIGHNIGFDQAFLRKLAFRGEREELAGISHRGVDTHTVLQMLALAHKVPHDAVTSNGAFQHFDITIDEATRHTALGDARATRQLMEKIMQLSAAA